MQSALGFRFSRWAVPVVATLAVLAGPAAAQPPGTQTEAQPAPARDVKEIIERAQRYVAEYAAALSVIIGVERYVQRVAYGEAGTLNVASGERPWTRETISEFALIQLKEQWVGYRDVYQVDGKPVSDRHDRLRQLFQGSLATAIDQGRRIADESARYNAGSVQRNFNAPTMALMFLLPANAGRFRFDKAGTDTVAGTPVWKVRYKETQTPTIIRSPEGRNLLTSGTFWIEPVTGKVLKTHVETTAKVAFAGGSSAMPESPGAGRMGHDAAADRNVEAYARVTASYELDEQLELLVPSEMVEEYQALTVNSQTGRERVARINCKATYSGFQRFETSGRVVEVK
jgi:hypothetical protein